jgi:hypothetical protein
MVREGTRWDLVTGSASAGPEYKRAAAASTHPLSRQQPQAEPSKRLSSLSRRVVALEQPGNWGGRFVADVNEYVCLGDPAPSPELGNRRRGRICRAFGLFFRKNAEEGEILQKIAVTSQDCHPEHVRRRPNAVEGPGVFGPHPNRGRFYNACDGSRRNSETVKL